MNGQKFFIEKQCALSGSAFEVEVYVMNISGKGGHNNTQLSIPLHFLMLPTSDTPAIHNDRLANIGPLYTKILLLSFE